MSTPMPTTAPEFIRRPQQGFVIPKAPEPVAPEPVLADKKRNEMLAISIGYLFLGFLMAQSESTLIWTLGGFVLLIGSKGLYESLMSLLHKTFTQR